MALSFLTDPRIKDRIRTGEEVRAVVRKHWIAYWRVLLEAVVAAAATIAGEHCLGQDEIRLRVMALLCLTSLVDVLQDAIVPVLPVAIPRAVQYLDESLQGESPDEELHSACYGFISSLAEHLPYMLSTYTDRVLAISNKSAEAGLDEETNESRTSCLGFLAKRLDAKDIFTSLDKNWEQAMSAGFSVRRSVTCREEVPR